MFDIFRKKKEESEDAGFGMVEERPGFNQDYSVKAFSSDARESINEEKLTEKAVTISLLKHNLRKIRLFL